MNLTPTPNPKALADLFQATELQVAQRSNLDPSTVYRVFHGDTPNPSTQTSLRILHPFILSPSIRPRWMGGLTVRGKLPPRRKFIGVDSFGAAQTYVKVALDEGRHIAADDAIVAMQELASSDQERGDAENQSGGVYKALGLLLEAQDCYSAAARRYRAAGDDVGLLKVQSNQANVWILTGDNLEAAVLLSMHIDRHPMASRATRGWAWINIGDAEAAVGNRETAVVHYEKAHELFEQCRDVEMLSKVESTTTYAQICANGVKASLGQAAAIDELERLEDELEEKNEELALTAGLLRAQATRDRSTALRIRDEAKAGRFGLIWMRAKELCGALAVLLAVSLSIHNTDKKVGLTAGEEVGDVGESVTDIHNTGK